MQTISFSRLIPALITTCIFLNACSNGHVEHESRVAKDAIATQFDANEKADTTSSGDGILSMNSSKRKIIRNADIRCRVNDVFQSTTSLEQLVISLGGQTTESHMDNAINETKSLPFSTDSLRQIQSYTTTSNLTLRVPFRQLDSLIAAVAKQAAFINNRNLVLDDVTLQFISNKLKNEALTANAATQRAQALSHKTREAIVAGEYADQRQETIIDRRIENQSINDQVNFATLKIALYQPERLDAMVVANTDMLMQPTFGQKMKMALNGGWQMLQNISLFLVQIWPLFLISLLLILIIKSKPAKRFSQLLKRKTALN